MVLGFSRLEKNHEKEKGEKQETVLEYTGVRVHLDLLLIRSKSTPEEFPVNCSRARLLPLD